ncbi:TetR/AcrR family transcriptional regulator [Ochrobactrum sp. BTU1]|uniref:TetR/AcrR family transcriptional regulator n=1 Tax=Ochrobactrum sp. BTU1 TaxID=2840456 RepID=UPI001C04B93C|nr:TetR/AcrR family transcriptional regulator [Ochrobactrum sp. BTU1]
MAKKQNPSTKSNILEAALRVIRTKGYTASSVDDICSAAGLSKGAFFHHFSSKEDLAIAAAEYWSEKTGGFFAAAPYHRYTNPLARVLGYVALRRELIQGKLPEFTCLVGTMTQEIYGTNPSIQKACWDSISGHADTLTVDIEVAMSQSGKSFDFTAKSLALHTQGVIQGAFILAKASGNPADAVDNIDHLCRYLQLLLNPKTA